MGSQPRPRHRPKPKHKPRPRPKPSLGGVKRSSKVHGVVDFLRALFY